MIKLLLFSVCSFSILPAFCQQDSLLKNFKFRISQFRALNFDMGGGSTYNNVDYPAGRSENSGGGFGFGLGYFTTKSTDNILLTRSYSIGSNYSGSTSNSNAGNNRSNQFSAASHASVLNKWFSKNKFIELGTDISGGLSRSKYKNSNTPVTSKQNYGDYSIAINTGIGIGRLENITDMQNALWLNDALQKSNRLSHTLSAAELHELGRTITKGNNTRVLDNRRRTQFVLKTVDSFFQKNNLVSKTDIEYFSNLNDILFFAINNYRLSGTEKFIRFTPFISDYSNDQLQNNNVYKYEGRAMVKSLNFSVGLNKHVPLNLTHQNNFGAALLLNYIRQDYLDRFYSADTITSEIKNNPTTKQAGLDLFFEHAIYPNTRTVINFRLQTLGGYENFNDRTKFFGSANLTGTFNYFISYRTRLNINLGTFYRYNISEKYRYMELLPNSLQLVANAGLSVNI